MSFAVRMQGVASRLLNKFDERTTKMQLIKQGDKTFNPTTGEYEFAASETFDITGVAVPYNKNLIDGTSILEGDINITITLDIEPNTQDKVVLDGQEHSIVSVTPYQYTGQELVIAYSVQVRR